MLDTVEFGRLLCARRQQAGLSQHELAERCGMRESAISRLERGERDPRLTTLVRLGRGLGIPPADLLDRSSLRGR